MAVDVASLIGRSVGNRNAVSVYSPTRRIVRPTGRVANAGTAQAILGGGPVEPQRVGTSSFGGASPQVTGLPGWTQALGGQPTGGGSRLDQLLASSRGGAAQVEEPGGFWGTGFGKALGTAVNNPIGRGVMAGLETLNYPRRVVQSSIQEVADAFNGGDADFGDWTQQIGDESFGFDNMVPDTGSSFLDGLIGFGGDMLLDPLTYVGGAGLYSGISGRTARAGTAATARSLGVKVAGLTVEETEARIARYGFSRFSNAARQELRDQLPGLAKNILDRGYHFKVPFTQRFWQIPGSELLDVPMSYVAGGVRRRLSESPAGGWMRYASNPNGMRDAITTMVTRRPTGGLSFAQAAEVINWNNGKKLAERAFTSKAVKMADDVVKQLGGGRQGREAANDLFRRAEAEGGTVIHGYWDAVRRMAMDEYGVHIPAFEGAYLPHFRMAEAQALMDEGSSRAATDFKNLLFKDVDLNASASVKLRRQLVAGKSINIAGKEYALTRGTADELNEIWRKAVPEATTDLIDTDFASVAHKYIKSLQDNVGTIGGLKKVLGSKSGLVHRLGDDSLMDHLTDADIDDIASSLTAGALKNQRRQVDSTLRQMRDDTRRGIKGVGGALGPEFRDAVNNMATVSPSTKTILDDALRTVGELEDQVGVGKYHERFLDGDPVQGPPGHPGRIQAEYDKARAVFTRQLEVTTKRFQALEAERGRLTTAAVAEARRLEAQGNVGATPIQDELRRVAAEQGATSSDMAFIETIIDRLDVNQQAQGVINTRLGDSDFINLAVADNLSPKSPGSPTGAATPAPPVYVGPAPAQVSTDFNAKTTQILGASDQQVAEVAARFEVQNRAVDRARERAWRAQVDHGEAADTAHRALVDARQYEAGLKHEVEATRGQPEMLQRNLDYSDRLEVFQQGELQRLQREAAETRRPIDDARSVLDVESRRLQEIRDEQMAIARNMDARASEPPAPPLTAAQEAAVKKDRWRTVRERNRWLRTPEGVAHTKATKAAAAVSAALEATSRRIDDITKRGGRFFIDADGVMQPKFTTQERWALDLIEERRSTLIPARQAADARHQAAVETWGRLERSGAPASEVAAAQREVSATFKARKQAEYAVTAANRQLTKIKDVPDFGAISRQTDELNALLTKQASQQARLDELGQQTLTSGQTLQKFEDSIAGADSQITLQNTARELALAPPATPYGAQVAANHRAELARLAEIEARFPAARHWDDPAELPAAPSDIGSFEGKWETNPTIRGALDTIGRVDGRRRLFDAADEAVELENSAAAIRTAAEPFTVPPVGTPAHTAVMDFSPASRGGAMGAVQRSQAVVAETQRVLDRHIPELVEAGAVPAELGDELFRQRLDLDRALDLHAANPTAHQRADLDARASDLGRLTEFTLRYKQALDGGNEASPGLASFILARQFDDEAASLVRQIDIGNARLATPAGSTAELGYARGLARLNERAAHLTDQIETELARARAGGDWDQRAVKGWTEELDRVQLQRDRIGPPANGVLDDAIDGHAAYLADRYRDVNDAEAIFEANRFVDHRMQWPVRRKDELTAQIPHVEAEVQAHRLGQRRLQEAVDRAHATGSTTVRYRPYQPEGFNGKVTVIPLAQAEANLANNAAVIGRVEHDLVNKQIQQSLLEGTAQERLTLLERELGDVEVPPNPVELALENDQIRALAQREQRGLTPSELETVASNQTRIERLNKGPLPQATIADMQDEANRLRSAIDDFGQVMDGDAAHISVARDPEPFLRGVAAGGGPISERSMAMLSDLVGPETANAAKVWIHYLDETFAGRTAATTDELSGIIDDAVGTFGDNELIDRIRERAVASLAADGTVSLDEMRDEFTAALIASANRQRGESMRETLSMQALFGTTYVDGPGGLRPRHIDAIADEPSHQLLTARLRTATVEAMQAKGYDTRNALVDGVADLRTRLGRVETMRRGVEGNEEWMDVLLTGTPSAQARAEVRATLQAGREGLQTEEQQLLTQGADVINRLDPDRAARNVEQQTQLAKQIGDVDNEMTALQQETDRLNREVEGVERTYTARLNEAGMQLGNARLKVVEARINHEAHEAHRDQLVRALKNEPGDTTESMRAALHDLDALNKARRDLGVDDADIIAIDAQLTAYAEDLDTIEAMTTAPDASAVLDAAKKNPQALAQVTKDLLGDQWRIIARGISVDDPEGYVISAGLARAVENVQRGTEDNKFWQFLDKYTAFFKTYATAKPGFHVRNAMSAAFMNLVDGVRVRDMYEGARLWRQYERNPNFLATADQRVRDAFDAVAASGAGGRYMEAAFGVNVQAGTKMYKRVMDNAVTRWNQRLGSRVEGSARLAMALNTMHRGGNATDAMARIAKFHFDYTEMSELDRVARRFIPFWTFMSRNLPLQLEQMFTNPRMYLQYQNLKRNMGETADPMTPEYWLSAGAFTLDQHAETREAPWYIAPDLPHLQVMEPMDALARGDFGKALLSDINPLIMAPLEAGAIGHKVFSGANLEGYEQTSAANPFVPLFNLIGAATPFDATATAGSGQTVIDKRAAHIARSLLPPWEFAERLLDPTGKRAGRTDETIYRALGLPVRQLNDELRRTTRQSQYYDRREAHDQQADLARM